MQELMDLLFAQIEHGDAEHRQWLRDKLNEFVKEQEGEWHILNAKDVI